MFFQKRGSVHNYYMVIVFLFFLNYHMNRTCTIILTVTLYMNIVS